MTSIERSEIRKVKG